MIIIGLGNVGLNYKNTYHNLGFCVVDKLAKMLNLKFTTTECNAKTAVTYVGGKKLVLAKPTTYMNLSGESVRELLGKYHATHEEFVVVYDDVDIPVGSLRLRKEGSAGTHNGMKSVVECIGGTDFKRVRVGIGFDHGEIPLMNVVLSKISGENKKLLENATDQAAQALMEFIRTNEFEKVMQNYNK